MDQPTKSPTPREQATNDKHDTILQSGLRHWAAIGWGPKQGILSPIPCLRYKKISILPGPDVRWPTRGSLHIYT